MASNLTNNAKSAVGYLQQKGWTREQASGIVANLQAESGVNLNTKALGDSGSAAGVAQWRGSRQADFQRVIGKPVTSANLNEQLEFVDWELKNTERAAGDRIRATKTAADAAIATDKFYERSNGLARAKRVTYANSLATGTPAIADAAQPTLPKPKVEPPAEEYIIDPRTGQRLRVAPEGTQPDFGEDVSRQIPTFGGVAAQPDNIDVTKPLTNVLHDYPSYTYGLSLHLLTAKEYNNIIAGRPFVPNRVLIASAGRYNNVPGAKQFIRSPYFSEDFYFDNFSMTTVIGTNQQSRNTNAIEFSFTLLEPYGMTLINRLLDQANDPIMECSNYLDMVYLIQIDFFANNNAGEVIGMIPGISKRFPIKITQMDIKASVKGAEYQVKAVPYNHSAFDQTTISIPANFEVSAGSINEFTQSLNGSMNGWQQDLVKNNKIGVPDTFTVQADPAISSSPMVSSEVMSPRDTNMANPSASGSIRQSNLGNASTDYNPQSRTFSINAGTSIDKVIDYAVRNSSYIQNQITIPDGMNPETYLKEKAKTANQPLNWYKIVPTVTLGDFDPVRNIYARNIVYTVQPYTIYNVKSDVAPQGKASVFLKEYNYMYTGKNDDIIDFDINFNTLYYTAQTAYRGALTNIYNVSASDTEDKKSKNSSSYNGSQQQSNNVMPMVVKPQVYNAKARATGGAITAKSVAVADLEDSLMTMSSADMLSVKLSIIGDPQFIKQDDCFYSPLSSASLSAGDPRLTANGSIRTDYGEIYVSLTFRTPIDVDESTGLMQFGPNFRTSVFSGLYRVLVVQSEFKNGLFTQTLDLIRIPNQVDYDYIQKPRATVSQRSTDITPDSLDNPNTKNITESATVSAIATADDATLTQPKNLPTPDTNVLTSAQEDLRLVNEQAQTLPLNGQTEPLSVVPLQENLSFNETFRRARAANNGQPGGVFEWNGKQYQTNIVGEDFVTNPTPVNINQF
jgi:hypothetical protein